jgi:hypothetical protein
LILRRGTAAALFTSRRTFSCSVNLPIRSLTLSGIGSETRQNGKFLVVASFGSQANGSRASLGCRETPQRRRRRRKTARRDEEGVVVEAIFGRRNNMYVCVIVFVQDGGGSAVYIYM